MIEAWETLSSWKVHKWQIVNCVAKSNSNSVTNYWIALGQDDESFMLPFPHYPINITIFAQLPLK